MNILPKLLPLVIATTLFACSSSDSGASGGPIIDSLDVPDTTSSMTVQGQTGPGVILTLTAHDDDSGLTALHVVFTETNQDQAIAIPSAPTTLSGQKFELVLLGAPKGAHPTNFHITDAKGRSSAIVSHTITIP